MTFETEALQSLQRLVRCDRRALALALASLAASARLAVAPRAWAWAAKALTHGTKAGSHGGFQGFEWGLPPYMGSMGVAGWSLEGEYPIIMGAI